MNRFSSTTTPRHLAVFAALAVTGLSATAQSAVTIYGRLNTTVESQKEGTAGRALVLNNNASRLGFRGTEDMGGGLTAGFTLEAGFDSSTGVAGNGGAFFGRESSVQVSGGFGTVKLGNWLPGSYLATADYVSMHNHDTGKSGDALYAFGAAFAMPNKVAYFTPNLGGFVGQASVSMGEGKSSNVLDLSGNYVAGSLHLGGGYSKQDKAQQMALRALYMTGPFTFGGYVQRESVDGSVNGKTRNIGRLSGMYTLGLSEFHLNVGSTQKGGTQVDKATQYTVGYNYNLSRRTKIYTYYSAINGQSDATKSNYLAFGVRHNF